MHVELWEFNPITEEWEKVTAVVRTARMVAPGQVVLGRAHLHWLHENLSGGNGLWELTDAIAGGGAVVLDHFSVNREGHQLHFDPPMYFANGIWLETFTNMTSIVFGYD